MLPHEHGYREQPVNSPLECVSQVATIVAAIVAVVLMIRAFFNGWLGKRLVSADELVLFAQWDFPSAASLVTAEVFHGKALERNADLTKKPFFLSIRNNGSLAVVGLRIHIRVRPDVRVVSSPLFEVLPEWEPGTNKENDYILVANPGVNLPRAYSQAKEDDFYARNLTNTKIGEFSVLDRKGLAQAARLRVRVGVTAENLESPAEYDLTLKLPP